MPARRPEVPTLVHGHQTLRPMRCQNKSPRSRRPTVPSPQNDGIQKRTGQNAARKSDGAARTRQGPRRPGVGSRTSPPRRLKRTTQRRNEPPANRRASVPAHGHRRYPQGLRRRTTSPLGVSNLFVSAAPAAGPTPFRLRENSKRCLGAQLGKLRSERAISQNREGIRRLRGCGGVPISAPMFEPLQPLRAALTLDNESASQGPGTKWSTTRQRSTTIPAS